MSDQTSQETLNARLWTAVRKGKVGAVDLLLEQKADPNYLRSSKGHEVCY